MAVLWLGALSRSTENADKDFYELATANYGDLVLTVLIFPVLTMIYTSFLFWMIGLGNRS